MKKSNIVSINENTNNIIKKHNELITKARYGMSLIAIKLVSTLIAMIKADDKDFHRYRIEIRHFKELIGSNSRATYALVHKAAKELMKNPFTIDKYTFNWVSSAEYEKGDSYVIFKIDSNLKPYLLELQKQFTKYNIYNILLLRSGYSIRFYELLIQKWNEYKAYNAKAKKYTFEINIEYLRELFKIPKSQLYGDIKRHIISHSQQQFKNKTNIAFDYNEIKSGRKVIGLEITIKVSENKNNCLHYLKTFMSYVNHLRDNYAGESKFFFYSQIDIGFGLKYYFFGIGPKGLIYATDEQETNIRQVPQELAEVIYNASYIGAQHLEPYRAYISAGGCMIKAQGEQNNEFKRLYNDLIEIYKEHNPRQRPLI